MTVDLGIHLTPQPSPIPGPRQERFASFSIPRRQTVSYFMCALPILPASETFPAGRFEVRYSFAGNTPDQVHFRYIGNIEPDLAYLRWPRPYNGEWWPSGCALRTDSNLIHLAWCRISQAIAAGKHRRALRFMAKYMIGD